MKKIGIVVFFAAILVGVGIAGLFSFGKATGKLFNFSFGRGEHGSGNVVTESRNISGFTGIDAGGVFQIEVTAQKDFAVEIEADDNLLQYIKTEVDGGTLEISTEKKLSTKNPIRIRISAPDIEKIEASGASMIALDGLKNEGLTIDSSGASKITVRGETNKLLIDTSGASQIDAENLTAENANVDASGASHISLFVTNTLRTDASGASSIKYAGNPKDVEKKSSGASSVTQKQ